MVSSASIQDRGVALAASMTSTTTGAATSSASTVTTSGAMTASNTRTERLLSQAQAGTTDTVSVSGLTRCIYQSKAEFQHFSPARFFLSSSVAFFPLTATASPTKSSSPTPVIARGPTWPPSWPLTDPWVGAGSYARPVRPT